MRTSFRIAILIFITLGFTSRQSLAQATQVPEGPPGGVNASKLPDADGIHLGMSVAQATAVMKALFPGTGLEILYSHYQNGPTWVSSLRGQSPDQSDSVFVFFSMPPNPQQVTFIQRGLILPAGKQPTQDNTVASLRQKYGKELASTENGAGAMAWAYDEQGQPANPQGPSNWRPADCPGQAIGTTSGETPPGPGLEVDYVLGPVPIAQQLPSLAANLCNRDVFVTAQLQLSNIQGTPVVSQIQIFMSEKPLALRNSVAGQQYLDGLAAAKQQQKMKNAQQQKAPTL